MIHCTKRLKPVATLLRSTAIFGLFVAGLMLGSSQAMAAKTDDSANQTDVSVPPPSNDFGQATTATVSRTAQGANNATRWNVSAPGGMRIRAFWCSTERNVGYWQPLPGATSVTDSADFFLEPKRSGHTYTMHLTRHQIGASGPENLDITQPTEMPPAYQLEPRVSVEKAGLVPGESLVLWSARITSQGTTMKVISFGIYAMKPGDQWPPDDSAPRAFLELADIARGVDPQPGDQANTQKWDVQRIGLSFELPTGWAENTFNEPTEDPRPHIFLQESVDGKPRPNGATIRMVRQNPSIPGAAKSSQTPKETPLFHDTVVTQNVNASIDVHSKSGEANAEVLTVHMNVGGPQPFLCQCTYPAADRAKFLEQIKALLGSIKPIELDPPAN